MFVLEGRKGWGVRNHSGGRWGPVWVRMQPGGRCRSRNDWKAPRDR